MPVIAVAAAVALDAGAIGAMAAGTLTTLSAITAIGATVSAIGAVTHNQTLSLVGGGLGIVGAVGTLASGAGVFDNVSDLFNSSSAGASGSSVFDNPALYDAEAGGAGAGASNFAPASALTATGNVDPAVFNAAGAINSTSLAPAEGNAEAIETGGNPDSVLGQSLSPGASSGGSAASALGPDGEPLELAPEAGADAGSGSSAIWSKIYDPESGGPMTAVNITAPPSGLLNWAKNNPLLSYGLIQAGGSFISGLTNPMTPAQINALNAQSDVNRATAALIQRENANQSQPLPTASVTGKPAASAGLINSSPVAAPMITGIPNVGATAAPLVTGVPA